MQVNRRRRSILISICLVVTVIALLGSFYQTMTQYTTSDTIRQVITSLNQTSYHLNLNQWVDSWVNRNYQNFTIEESGSSGTDVLTSLPPIFENGSILIDRRVAEEVSKMVKVLCWIPTREVHRDHRLKAVNETWARRCDKIVYFMTSPKFKTHDVINVPIVDARKTLTEKTVFAHNYIYKNYLQDYDWFLKADDDTYIIMENLKLLLSKFDLETPGYIGCQFKNFAPQGYMSGGASYAFNSLGIKIIVENGYRIPGRCRLRGGAEDIETGRCAYKAGIQTLDNLDKTGKQTFFPSNVYANVIGPIPSWVVGYSTTKVQAGLSCCSPLLVAFHYTGEKLAYTMEFLLYRVVVHGRREVLSKADEMFKGQEAPEIPQEVRRRSYPGEKLEDYYKADWREKNTTIYNNPAL